MKKLLIILTFGVIFSACEKDDICDPSTPTTPKVVIDFYDATTGLAKTVNQLAIQEVGSSSFYETFTGKSKITIPLKTTADVTKYRFILNNKNTVVPLQNEDFLEFNYTRNNVYISRACGYKTLFTLKGIPVKTDSNPTDGFWIQNITVQTTNISTENETHIKIFFN